MIRTTALAIALVVILLAAVTANADTVAEAQRHVERATELHGQDKFTEAGGELLIAYALDPKPELLYAIGQVQVKLGSCGLAIAFYTRFLATRPATSDMALEAIETCKTTQPSSTPVVPKAEAKRRVDRATTLHQNHQFQQSLDELVMSYALDPDVALLFAIGQLHVKLDHCDQAIPYYERFVGANPNAAGAAEASQAITVCKERLAKPNDPPPPVKPPVEPPPVKPPPPPPPAGHWYSDKLGLALLGGGVALSLVGVIEYRAALGALDDAEAAPTYPEHNDLVDSAKSKRTIAAICGAGAVALTGGAVIKFVLGGKGHESHGVAIVPTGGGGLVTWSGGF